MKKIKDDLIGDTVHFIITDTSGRTFQCEGIVNGRITTHGGKQYLIKGWSVINPPELGIRKIKIKVKLK